MCRLCHDATRLALERRAVVAGADAIRSVLRCDRPLLVKRFAGRGLKAALRQSADFHSHGRPAGPRPLTPANQDQSIRVLVRDGIDSRLRSDSLSKVAVHAHSGPLCLLLKRFVSYTGNLLSDVGPASRSSLADCMEGDVAVRAKRASKDPRRGLPGCEEWAARVQLKNSSASLVESSTERPEPSINACGL